MSYWRRSKVSVELGHSAKNLRSQLGTGSLYLGVDSSECHERRTSPTFPVPKNTKTELRENGNG